MRGFLLLFISLVGLMSCKTYPELNGNPNTELIEMNNQIKGLSAIDSIIQPYKIELSKSMDVVIGSSEVEMFKQRPEGLLGNAIADIVYQQLNERSGLSCDLVLLNHGGLRAPIGMGDITVGRVYEVMPFDNQIAVVELKGHVLKKALNLAIKKGGDPISNATVHVTAKDTVLMIAGDVLQEGDTYRLATSDYMANGGDSYDMLQEGVISVSDLLLRDVIMEGIRHSKVISSELDGRFVLP